MSSLIAVRIDDQLIEEVDQFRKKDPRSRAQVVREGLLLWLEKKRLQAALKQHREGYTRIPVTDDEFGVVLGAQQWPK